jgi:hypothetical protein
VLQGLFQGSSNRESVPFSVSSSSDTACDEAYKSSTSARNSLARSMSFSLFSWLVVVIVDDESIFEVDERKKWYSYRSMY